MKAAFNASSISAPLRTIFSGFSANGGFEGQQTLTVGFGCWGDCGIDCGCQILYTVLIALRKKEQRCLK